MRFRFLSAALAVTALFLPTASCDATDLGGATVGPHASRHATVKHVVLSPDSANITVGTSQQFTATYYDATGIASNQAVTWSVLNAAIATVTTSGLVAGVSAGRTLLIASAANVADTSTVVVGAAGGGGETAYLGTPWAVPGTVQAENFDDGGEGVGYHDADAVNSGGQYRSTGVDIKATTDAGGGYAVGWTAAGEWLRYTVNIAATGPYIVGVRVATPYSGKSFHLEQDGVDVSGSVAVPVTGAWTTFTTVSKTVTLDSGSHVLKFVVDQAPFDINRLVFTSGTLSSTCNGVAVSASASIQNAVNNNPSGTTFCLGAGTFVNQSFSPKTDDKFIGVAGSTVMDGGNAVGTGINRSPNGALRVTVKHVILQHYTAAPGSGAISTSGSPGHWLIDSVELRYNKAAGIAINDSSTLSHSYLHHNGQEGYFCVGRGITLYGNEIAYNNYQDLYNAANEAGGGKCVKTDNLLVRKNYSHDNHGPGLWTDISNIHTTYDSNTVTNNGWSGIDHEISYDAVIRYNTISGNGFSPLLSPKNWVEGACIFLVSSQNVKVHDNTCTSNYNGITADGNPSRGTGTNGVWKTANDSVYDNTITQSLNRAGGIARNGATDAVFTSQGNHWEHNTYHFPVGSYPAPFWWLTSGDLTVTQWQTAGNDTTGTFSRP